jgi:hypothetical protein
MIFFEGKHRTQFDGSSLAKENCTPTSGANGARASTGGKVDRSGGEVRALVKNSEESDSKTAGWSLNDLNLGMQRLGVPFQIKKGKWSNVEAAIQAGLFVVLQGDSDQFGNGTCSGKFDGDHCVGLHPGVAADGTWLLADPICPGLRREQPAILRAYAEKFAGGEKIRFGVFTTPVPQEDDVTITAVKGEDWKPTANKDTGATNGVLRAVPDRTAPIIERVDLGQTIRSIAEVKGLGGSDWRLTKFKGKTLFMLRSDFTPLVQNGDPAVDQALSDYIARV